MKFLEKNLEDIIFETPNHKLSDRGLWIKGKKLRQVRIGNYGIADLITIDYSCPEFFDHEEIKRHGFDINIGVFELKKDCVNVGTLLQAVRYIKGCQRFFEATNRFDDLHFNSINYRVTLIGKEIEVNSPVVYMPEMFENLYLYTYDYTFDGLYFSEKSGYKLINEGF